MIDKLLVFLQAFWILVKGCWPIIIPAVIYLASRIAINYRRTKREASYQTKRIEEEKQYLTPKTENDTISTEYNVFTENNEPAESEEKLIKELIEEPKEIAVEFTGKYQKRYLLTKNEYSQYKKLKQYADSNNLLICPKVRLLDLIEPRRGDPKYKTFFYKIQAKHVDFVICDHNLYVKAILEIDDSSHDQENRKERDEFVDCILRDVGYAVIRTRYITEDTLSTLKQVLSGQTK